MGLAARDGTPCCLTKGQWLVHCGRALCGGVRPFLGLREVAHQTRVACKASDLVHIEMPVHCLDPGDRSSSRKRMLHDTINCVLEAIKTRDPARPQLGRSHPKNEGRLREVYIVHSTITAQDY